MAMLATLDDNGSSLGGGGGGTSYGLAATLPPPPVVVATLDPASTQPGVTAQRPIPLNTTPSSDPYGCGCTGAAPTYSSPSETPAAAPGSASARNTGIVPPALSVATTKGTDATAAAVPDPRDAAGAIGTGTLWLLLVVVLVLAWSKR